MATPSLLALHRYPVKSLAGHAPDEAVVEPWGLAGDRRWLLTGADGAMLTQRSVPGLARLRAAPLPDGGIEVTAPGREPLRAGAPGPGATVPVQVFRDEVEAVPAGPAADAWFSALLGAGTRLLHLDDPAHRRPVDPAYGRPGETVGFADGFPLLLTTTASLDALNSWIAEGDHAHEGPLPMNRFRPNAVIGGTEPWEEDDWAAVRIGGVVFRVVKPCARCVITTTDQRTGERGREPLRTLARKRNAGGRLLFGQNLIPEGTGTLRLGDPVQVVARRPR
ncbi:MOSC domain-containing protein [Streptomyces sp. F63]|uniref:MOSC domain-containing protein n=1 Tax=Streptomyces sp. F63 TaxID=2824887 RepID=UPI001B3967DF|nr:MOSC N-terminal beta barrel domain-containing protein [Streptomyces sp. F63]MBQ0985753.1 MOSC domain-containing protein [Streptomyces sp. F63]